VNRESLDPVRALNVVHICDHLGWSGSRMHGVKRLFAWMIPRFDRKRFNVSLISLRQRDLSNDTLDELGIDVSYLQRSKFDPLTAPALLKELDRRKADILHMHGYGATTFGRIAAAVRELPAIVHEHANLTDTPWFQKIADRLLARHTDIALAVSRSTAEFTTRARLLPAERTKVVYLGVPLDEFSRPRTAEEIQQERAALGIPPGVFAVGTVTRLMPSKGNEFLVEAARLVVDRVPNARFYIVGEGELQTELESRARAIGLGDRLTFA
jgi:glycosyltransferase involved in cell wall biosynthesis